MAENTVSIDPANIKTAFRQVEAAAVTIMGLALALESGALDDGLGAAQALRNVHEALQPAVDTLAGINFA